MNAIHANRTRYIRAFNGEARVERAARWTGSEATIVASLPRSPVTEIALRPEGPLLVLHLEGVNSRALARCEGRASVRSGPTLGKVGLLPGGCLIHAEADFAAPVRHLALHLKAELFAAGAQDSGAECTTFRPSLDVADPVLVGHMRELAAELQNPGLLGRLHAEGLSVAIAVRLARAHSSLQQRLARGGLPPRRLRRVQEHIESELAGEITLAELAGIAGLSVSHFCRAFRQSTGMAPHQYVIGRRIARAKELLARSQLSIAQIALEAGFASQSHLNAHFARALDTTPKRFRHAS